MPLTIAALAVCLLLAFAAGVTVGRRRERQQLEDRLFGIKVRLR